MAGMAIAGFSSVAEYENSLLPKTHRDFYDKAEDEFDAALAARDSVQPDAPAVAPAPDVAPVPMVDPLQTPAAPASAASEYEQRLARLEGQIDEQRAENARLRAELATPPPAAPAAPVIPLTREEMQEHYGLSDEELDAGVEVVTAAQKIAQRIAEQEIARVRQDLQRVETAVSAKQVQEYIAQRALRIPDFETLKNDPKFLKWLDGKEPMSGMTRHALAQSALDAFDVDRLEEICNAYRPKPGPAATPHVMPSTLGAATPPAAPPKKTYTKDEFTRLSGECARLMTSDPRRAQELNAELDAAWAEGRVGN